MSDSRAEDGTPTWRCDVCGRVRPRYAFDDVTIDGQVQKVCSEPSGCELQSLASAEAEG